MSAACNVFVEHYTGDKPTCSISSLSLNIETEECTTKFSSRWLLHHLIIYLNKFLDFKCIHQRFGTILYRKNGDILTSLSWALGACAQQNVTDIPTLGSPQSASTTKHNADKKEQLRVSALIINDILHNEIKKISKLPEMPYLPLKECLSNIDTNLIFFWS